MDKYIILIYVFLVCNMLHSQNIIYNYDNAGNRIDKSASQTPSFQRTRLISENDVNINNEFNQEITLRKVPNNVDSLSPMSSLNDFRNGYEVNITFNKVQQNVIVRLNDRFLLDQSLSLEIINNRDEIISSSLQKSLQTSFDMGGLSVGVYRLRINSDGYENEWEIRIE